MRAAGFTGRAKALHDKPVRPLQRVLAMLRRFPARPVSVCVRSSMSTVWINGRFDDEAVASVSVRDAGLLHGAGVFTTMRSYGGRVFRLDQHLRRLRESCDALFIPLQHRDEALAAAVEELLHRNELADARLRLTVTRG